MHGCSRAPAVLAPTTVLEHVHVTCTCSIKLTGESVLTSWKRAPPVRAFTMRCTRTQPTADGPNRTMQADALLRVEEARLGEHLHVHGGRSRIA